MTDLTNYKKYLENEAKKFRLTAEDLSNLTDLGMMIDWRLYEYTLKPNKMNKWFIDFFNRIEDVTLDYDIKLKEKSK